MEGREPKHVQLKEFAKNVKYEIRWHQIFQHEFLTLIWLRENGAGTAKYRRRDSTLHT